MSRTDRFVNRRIEEAYRHIRPYMDELGLTEKLRKTCELCLCENYRGKEHDYTECEDMPCFRYFLAYQYLKGDASWS